ncbi:intermembrane phospholipid transport protein YdbH family protein [Photobacterium sanguinicancri]|uniref:intermembrane phospholipid transport protein YdbH family protein n=1 Tax=Photobacterium sanguinicancri TaxID=875932 RepID=UPI0026E44648|nr:YdbH domain-containing protein [Photobacterium sanguinicancri]MDO6499226.1 YdbH domain-containing protein [Photobacterium sanguinicancri]
MNDEVEQTADRTQKPIKRFRFIRRLLFVLCCAILMIAIATPMWLASKGIIINAISGISLYPQIKIDHVAVEISGAKISTHQLTIDKYFDDQSAISASSWRISADTTRIGLPAEAKTYLKKIGYDFPYFLLRNTALNFTDLSNPYVFSASSDSINVQIDLPFAQPQIQTQQLNNIHLVIATKPNVAISGIVGSGQLNLFIPAIVNQLAAASDKTNKTAKIKSVTPSRPSSAEAPQNTPIYPTKLSKGNFSIAWQEDTTPLSISINKLTPQWEMLPPEVEQQLTELHFEMDIQQPSQSIKLQAENIHLGHPKILPKFIKRGDASHQGLHLGETIASLATLPLNVLKVNHLMYGDLILDAKVVLKTPLTRDKQEDRQARFRIDGKVLGPIPYDLKVLLKHKNNKEANFTGHVKGPKGNTLDCQADIEFIDPLPQKLFCQANFKNTHDIMSRFALTHLPSAELNAPITVTASRVANTRYNQVVDRQLIDAFYKLAVKLPPTLNVKLNQFALPGKHLSDQPTPADVETITLHTDGELNLKVHYRNRVLKMYLEDKTEAIALSTKWDNKISLLIDDLTCQNPELQCHLSGLISTKINQVFPFEGVKLERLEAQSHYQFSWSTQAYGLILSKLALNTENMILGQNLLGRHLNLLNAQQTAVQIDTITISKTGEDANIRVLLPEKSTATLTTNLFAEQTIKDQNGQPVDQNLSIKRSLLPVQKYEAKTEVTLRKIDLSLGQVFNLSSHYDIATHFKQNNQRFPKFSTVGKLVLRPNNWRFQGNIDNWKQATLAKYTLSHKPGSNDTAITLHRNDIEFNNKKTLKKYYLPQFPLHYDFTHGSISYDGQFTLRGNEIKGRIGLFTHQLTGEVSGFRFGNVNTSITADITPQGIKSRHPISIHAGLFHAGALFEDIVANLEFDTHQQRYQLHRAHADVLGGKISVHNASSNSLLDISPKDIRVHGLDLALLIQLLEQDDIELTGIVDGVIPLSIEDGSPSIKSGHLHSRFPGGILRYLEGSSIDQNVEAAGENSVLVVGKILKNYNYHSLAIDLDYSKDGQLNASSRFKGFNPSFQNGRPVHLNLNVQDDIPALIKTINAINSSQLESLFLKQLGLNE